MEERQKEAYQEPLLVKHEPLRDLTRVTSPKIDPDKIGYELPY